MVFLRKWNTWIFYKIPNHWAHPLNLTKVLEGIWKEGENSRTNFADLKEDVSCPLKFLLDENLSCLKNGSGLNSVKHCLPVYKPVSTLPWPLWAGYTCGIQGQPHTEEAVQTWELGDVGLNPGSARSELVILGHLVNLSEPQFFS